MDLYSNSLLPKTFQNNVSISSLCTYKCCRQRRDQLWGIRGICSRFIKSEEGADAKASMALFIIRYSATPPAPKVHLTYILNIEENKEKSCT